MALQMFRREQFNSSIKEFHSKYSDKWSILIQENQFQKSSQVYLKMASTFNDLEIDSYIVYSDSYGQPILYFLPMLQFQDSSRFASIDELRPYLSSEISSISLSENPINGLLMYSIHPCFTAEFMFEIFNSIEDSDHGSVKKCTYIESWLSFCPFIPVKKYLRLECE